MTYNLFCLGLCTAAFSCLSLSLSLFFLQFCVIQNRLFAAVKCAQFKLTAIATTIWRICLLISIEWIWMNWMNSDGTINVQVNINWNIMNYFSTLDYSTGNLFLLCLSMKYNLHLCYWNLTSRHTTGPLLVQLRISTFMRLHKNRKKDRIHSHIKKWSHRFSLSLSS